MLPFLSPLSRKAILSGIACLLASSALAGSWTLHPATGERPSERSTPALGAIGNDLFVFGGVLDDYNTGIVEFYNDLYRFDASHDRWTKLEPFGTARPSPRGFASYASDPSSKRFYVYGGSSYGPFFSDFTVFDDLWAYNVQSNTWTKIQAVNQGPSGRSKPAVWMVGHKLYVFGGITEFFSTLNDLWVYDTKSNAWTQLMADGAAGAPPSRHEALTGTRAQANKLVIYGGETLSEFGFVPLSDVWEYDLAKNRWNEVTPAQNLDPARNLAASGIVSGDLYLHGGDLPGGSDCCGAPFPQNVSGETWKLDLQHKTWSEVTSFTGAAPHIKQHRGIELGGELFVFGGYDFIPEGEVGQVWNLDVYSFRP